MPAAEVEALGVVLAKLEARRFYSSLGRWRKGTWGSRLANSSLTITVFQKNDLGIRMSGVFECNEWWIVIVTQAE